MAFLYDPFAPTKPEGAFEGYFGLSGVVSTEDKCGPWPPKIPYDIYDLDPKFRPVVRRLLQRMKELGLDKYFYPVSGLRSLNRQCRARCEGGSSIKDPSRGAHTAGFAVDFHARRGAIFKHAYDTGLDTYSHTKYENPAATSWWLTFGSLIKNEFPELEWGGDWKGRYRERGFSDGDIKLGWDPYHVELKDYRKHLPERGYWKCDGGKAVKIEDPAEKAKAAAERIAEEEPSKLMLPLAGLSALLLGAWYIKRRK